MKNMILCLCILSAAMLAGSVFGASELPSINAVFTQSPPLIDGNLDENGWKNASHVTDFKLYTGDAPASQRTEAYMLYDRNNLYVAFVCYDSRMGEIKSESDVFKGDSVELFIDPGRTFEYTHVASNPRGDIYFAWQQGNRKNNVKSAAKVLADRWQVEMAIPLAGVKMPSAKDHGALWGINFCRNNPRTKENGCWSPTLVGFHNPARFGILKGISLDEDRLRAVQQAAETPAVKDLLSIESDKTFYCSEKAAALKIFVRPVTSLKGTVLEVRAADESGKTRFTKNIKPVLLTNALDIPVSSLPIGKHVITVSLRGEDGRIAGEYEACIFKVPAYKPLNTTLIKDGILYVDGKPYLPIGLYFGAHWEKYKVMSAGDVEDAADKGFNTLIPVWPFFKEDLQECKNMLSPVVLDIDVRLRIMQETSLTMKNILDIAQKKDMKVVGWMPYIWGGKENLSSERLQAGMNTILKYREHPSMLCWMSNDETDGWIETNRRLYKLYKELDASHPVWLNLIAAVASNKDCADILSTDPYPIGKAPITKVSAYVETLREILHKNGDQSFWVVLQMFGSPPEGWPRCPSPAEERCMTFLALNHGAKGLVYFGYTPEVTRTEKGDKALSPELWNYMKELNAQTKEMSMPYLLGKNADNVGCTEKTLDIAAKEYEGNIYIIACNTTGKEITADISCSELQTGDNAEVLFENRNITRQNGLLRDTFSGYAVHIYVLTKTTQK